MIDTKGKRFVNRQLHSMVWILVLFGIMTTAGCSRAFSDGISIGVTDCLSDGISALVEDWIGLFSGDIL